MFEREPKTEVAKLMKSLTTSRDITLTTSRMENELEKVSKRKIPRSQILNRLKDLWKKLEHTNGQLGNQQKVFVESFFRVVEATDPAFKEVVAKTRNLIVYMPNKRSSDTSNWITELLAGEEVVLHRAFAGSGRYKLSFLGEEVEEDEADDN